ncbi:MAG: UDPGP type 1 family protein [Phycisphaerae bacterium]|nr:UDPGP type 1 family protein [Phycisphaerae bacterium]
MTTDLNTRIQTVAKTLEQNGQGHLLKYIDELSDNQKLSFVEQLEKLDFGMLNDLIEKHVKNESHYELPENILPPEVYPLVPGDDLKEKYCQATKLGQNMIAANKVAAFTVAGGMGTRLSFDGPKGNFPATPIKNKSLFNVFAEYIQASQKRYGSVIPWYIMTSPSNHAATVKSFEDNNYFGLNPDDVMMFPQNMMPCFGFDGKIILAEKDSMALSPDGHGGSLRALYTSGAIDDMTKRGVEYISYFQIDNPIVYCVDPLFVGLHAMDKAQMSSKAVIKCEPLEKVGNFTIVDGRVTVIEYSDLPDELAYQKNEDGKLLFESGSIAIHIISRDFVQSINAKGFSLPWHRAVKKIPFIDNDGNTNNPEKPNGVKLESFVFDALPLASESVILGIDRDEQFAPIKNATGTDSIDSSRELQIARACRWLAAAGIEVPTGTPVEISSDFALDPQELKAKKSEIPPITPGEELYLG